MVGHESVDPKPQAKADLVTGVILYGVELFPKAVLPPVLCAECVCVCVNGVCARLFFVCAGESAPGRVSFCALTPFARLDYRLSARVRAEKEKKVWEFGDKKNGRRRQSVGVAKEPAMRERRAPFVARTDSVLSNGAVGAAERNNDLLLIETPPRLRRKGIRS